MNAKGASIRTGKGADAALRPGLGWPGGAVCRAGPQLHSWGGRRCSGVRFSCGTEQNHSFLRWEEHLETFPSVFTLVGATLSQYFLSCWQVLSLLRS